MPCVWRYFYATSLDFFLSNTVLVRGFVLRTYRHPIIFCYNGRGTRTQVPMCMRALSSIFKAYLHSGNSLALTKYFGSQGISKESTKALGFQILDFNHFCIGWTFETMTRQGKGQAQELIGMGSVDEK